MKLNEFLAANTGNEIADNVITIYEGKDVHLFISEKDFESFDLAYYGEAEVVEFKPMFIDMPTCEPLPYFSIRCEMPKTDSVEIETLSAEIEAMRITAERFFDYLDERCNDAGARMFG